MTVSSPRLSLVSRRAFLAFVSLTTLAHASTGTPAADRIREALSASNADHDYVSAKLVFDSMVDPTIDVGRVTRDLAELASRARELAGAGADDMRKLAAVRMLIYRDGPWNDHRPFAYDHADPYGRDVRNKLLSTYLETRRGNCVSMPILFLILADALGARVALCAAPLHVFVRHFAEDGGAVNLEATSGALPARDVWYRENLPITDAALANGLYLRTLSRREGVALMAVTVMEHLMGLERYEEALAVGAAIREAAPRDVETLVRCGTAYGRLLEREFISVYPSPDQIPPGSRARYAHLAQMNAQAFAEAEALGWREPDE